MLGGRVWYDDHLFRDGVMNPADAGSLVAEWEGMGFERPADLCVVEAVFGGATTQPCDWICVDTDQRVAHMKGTEFGAVARPER